MKLAHISDLHFGREKPEAVRALTEALGRLVPDLVVVSGDLTQRALPKQFQDARRFLDGLGRPWIAVPGNHDIPLYAIAARIVRPLDRYRQWLHPQTEIGVKCSAATFFGLNTAGRIAWKKGRVKSWQSQRAHEFFSIAPPELPRVLVAHHPVVDDDPEWRGRVLETGADLILSGHQHRSGARLLAVEGDRGPWIVLSGTSVSAREREETNAFNEIELGADGFRVCVHSLSGAGFERGDWTERRWGDRMDARVRGGVSVGKKDETSLN